MFPPDTCEGSWSISGSSIILSFRNMEIRIIETVNSSLVCDIPYSAIKHFIYGVQCLDVSDGINSSLVALADRLNSIDSFCWENEPSNSFAFSTSVPFWENTDELSVVSV
jgi:hypothetical protein